MTSEPEFWRLAAVKLGPPAASERMSGLSAEQGTVMPPSAGLKALALDQEEPLAAGPRQTRQVPMRMLEVSAGSRSVGAASWAMSPSTCVEPMVAGGRKLEAVQLPPSGQASRFTPAPMGSYQLAERTGSMEGRPPSPVESCGQGVKVEAVVVAAEPFAPRPAMRVLGLAGSCAKPTVTASEPPVPMAALRLSKWVLSEEEQTLPVSATPSSERQRPPSLPRKGVGMPLGCATVAIACWAAATCAGALQPSSALVVLRRMQVEVL